MRPDDAIEPGRDARALVGGLTLLRLGGHFVGGTVLHDATRSTLLSGDIVQVIPTELRQLHVELSQPRPASRPRGRADRRRARTVAVQGSSAWWGTLVPTEGSEVVRRSAARYVAALAHVAK